MNTPIYDFVKKYSSTDSVRLHMPGHKGKSFLGVEALDITEINGADVLFDALGIIGESEKNAASLFNTARTLYSTEGSTLCIKTMLSLVRKSSKKNRILASRNSHKALIYGCAMLDIDVDWLWNESDTFSLCRCIISAENLDKRLSEYNELPCAVYVTSPDYLGGESDIKELAEIAHKYGVPLIVDNAHGSYLHFLEEKRHPIDLGADMCCDSAHKTLPVLTGGAYLHISKNADENYCLKAKKMMELFASTSPSYLILQSLDLCNAYLSDGYDKKLLRSIENIDSVKEYLTLQGWTIEKSDPLKLTVMSVGTDLSAELRQHNIECEYEDPDYTVMMFTPENSDDDFDNVRSAMGKCEKKLIKPDFSMPMPVKVMSVREAILSDWTEVSTAEAVGKICASPVAGCPPAVPVAVCGEIISKQAASILEYYGINKCLVTRKLTR